MTGPIPLQLASASRAAVAGYLALADIAGLALTLSRPPTTVDIQASLLSGDKLRVRLDVPDVIVALCIKAETYRGRFADKDAIDL